MKTTALLSMFLAMMVVGALVAIPAIAATPATAPVEKSVVKKDVMGAQAAETAKKAVTQSAATADIGVAVVISPLAAGACAITTGIEVAMAKDVDAAAEVTTLKFPLGAAVTIPRTVVTVT